MRAILIRSNDVLRKNQDMTLTFFFQNSRAMMMANCGCSSWPTQIFLQQSSIRRTSPIPNMCMRSQWSRFEKSKGRARVPHERETQKSVILCGICCLGRSIIVDKESLVSGDF